MSTWNLGKRNGPGLVKPSMNSGNPAKTHIAPERLWQSACGGAELQSSEYLHLVGCVSCDKLSCCASSIARSSPKTFACASRIVHPSCQGYRVFVRLGTSRPDIHFAMDACWFGM